MREKTPLYVLNNFLKFEKKIYRFNDIKLSRPLYIKTVLYFIGAFIAFLLIVLLPGIGTLIRMLPQFFVIVLIVAVPMLAAHLLGGVGTENRPPINAFKALFDFHVMKAKRETYYKGNIIKQPKPVQYQNHSTVRIAEPRGKQHEPIDQLSSEAHRQKPRIQSGRDDLGIL